MALPSPSDLDSTIPNPPLPGKVRHTGPLGVIDSLFTTSTEKTTTDETLIDIKIHNPLKRITKILQEIKDHQSTTVSLRFTIPLIALPVILLLTFQLGRAQTLCSSHLSTQVGTIKRLQVMVPAKQTELPTMVLQVFPFLSYFTKSTEMISQPRIILTQDGKTPLHIVSATTIDMTSYENQVVFVTGSYSSCGGEIHLDSPVNISLAN